jgi:hypothetical protein
MKRTITPWLTLAAAFAIVACSDSSGPSTGTLSMRLTDAPFPYEDVARADMWVVRIDAKMDEASDADAANVLVPAGNTDPRHGWVTLATPNHSVDLLTLQNGTTTNLGEITLPTGTYRGFRLILDTDKSSITLKNGTVLNGSSSPGVKWPSAGQSGIKIKLDQPIGLVSNGTVMVIDFDLGKSFVLRGNSIGSNGLLFKPVIRGVAHDITGSVSGTVVGLTATGPVIPSATVEALVAGTSLTDSDPINVLRTTQTDAFGVFHLDYMMPGSYEIRATPPTGAPYTPALLQSISVNAGTDAASNTIVLPALPTP